MLSIVESQIRAVLEAASNDEPVVIDEAKFEAAGREFGEKLKEQFGQKDRSFKLRMSNIGRPVCQLQQEKSGSPRERFPYNHVVRMLIGDATEIIIRLAMEMAGVNVTSDGDQTELDVDGVRIKGTSDIDIDGSVWDIKSCSPWAFQNKWSRGFEGLLASDDFGYIGQLYGYADAQGKKPGGWIVVDKSSGEIALVPVEADTNVEKAIRQQRKETIRAVVNDEPFRRCFEPQEEYYRRKKTGKYILAKECSFCPFTKSCWPKAVYKESEDSTAKEPPKKWYLEKQDVDLSLFS